jgi:Amidohydrolase family
LSSARALKLDREIGTVQVGKRANLLLVRADPRKTIQAYQEIAKVILGGRVLTRIKPTPRTGGERGIRTLEGLLTLTPLAGVRLRPLGHLSADGNFQPD